MAGNNYIKLPNQGNISSNLRLLFEMQNSSDYADSHGYFRKKDIAEIAANALLVTTSSRVGSDVISAINNTDVDEGDNSPLQNAKMRMQIMRILGLVSADYNSEIYAITEIGKLIVSDNITNEQKINLLRELFLCIESSSESYDFTCDEGFHCFLGFEICYAFACLDYKIAVDEMPIITTYDIHEIQDFIADAKQYRAKGSQFPKTHAHYPKTKRGTPLRQSNNLTRTINQILRFCNIVQNKSFRQQGKNYYVCTDFGKTYVDNIKQAWDAHRINLLTPYDFRKSRILEQIGSCKQGLDNILIRSKIVQDKSDTGLVFSPYQMLPETNVAWLLRKEARPHPESTESRVQAINSSLTVRDLRLRAIFDQNANVEELLSKEEALVQEISAIETPLQRQLYIEVKIKEHQNDDKSAFYPYIHSLLNILGLDCKGEVGRYDAYSEYNGHVIPAEIKSPTEEISYNQKGIRQAIENKICSYKPLVEGDIEYASLVVGYTHPSNDALIRELIDASNEVYKINIIAIDLRGLLDICTNIICNKMSVKLDELLKGYGMIIG